LPEVNCPNDLDVCFGGTCCPTSLNCVESGAAVALCCPGTVSCQAPYQASPYCADDTWSLWDMSQGGINNEGYFCCAPGMVGLLSRACVANDTISSPTQLALELQPGGGVLSTSSVIASTVVSTSVALTTVASTSVSTSMSSIVVVSSSVKSLSSITTEVSTTSSIGVETTTTATSSASGSTSSSASPSPTTVKQSDGHTNGLSNPLWLVGTSLTLLIGAVL